MVEDHHSIDHLAVDQHFAGVVRRVTEYLGLLWPALEGLGQCNEFETSRVIRSVRIRVS